MFHKFKIPLIIVFTLLIVFWLGGSFFSYFNYSELPEIRLLGLQKDGYYSGNLSCAVKSDSNYKLDKVEIFLDGEKFTTSQGIGKKSVEVPFNLNTFELKDGKHTLEVSVIDASYNHNKNKDIWNFYIDNVPLKAALLQEEYVVHQGHTVHLKFKSNKKLLDAKVRFLEKYYDCFQESEYSNIYECFIPIECEQNVGEYLLHADLTDFVKNEVKLTGKATVKRFNFPRQKRGFVVAKEKLDEEKEISMNTQILEDALEKWLLDSPKAKLWSGNFDTPILVKRVSTPFGEIRISPEKGKYIHKAVDILNFPKSVVWASQAGKVIIKDRFLMTGNTVVIDHGLGVTTIYCHLEDFADIEVGDFLKKGNPIGRLGMTGYADGYHLHWELRVNNIAVDPMQWTQKNF